MTPHDIAARLLLAALVLVRAGDVCAATLAGDEVFSSIVAEVIAAPNPVLGADRKQHLAYALLVVNPTGLVVTLESVTTLAGAQTVGELRGAALEKLMRVHGGGKGRTLPPGGSAFVLLDATFAAGATVPGELAHRIAIARATPGKDGAAPQPLPAGGALPADVSFVGARTTVHRTPAVVIAPPLRGRGWLVFNGCCDAYTSHRGAILPINGRLRVSERFAIDFVRLDEEDRLMTGPVDQLASYPYFGVPVHSVADGTVVNVDDGHREEVPGKVPADSSPATAGGNFVVVDIGDGRYAFYAHLQPASLRVKLGDRVKAGDVIGLLGNSGNTTAPHLHFHVMDGTSPLGSNGLPYVFTSFVGEGVLDEDGSAELFETSVGAVIERARLAGPHDDELPLDDMVVRFPD
jgi:hypothetical protein